MFILKESPIYPPPLPVAEAARCATLNLTAASIFRETHSISILASRIISLLTVRERGKNFNGHFGKYGTILNEKNLDF